MLGQERFCLVCGRQLARKRYPGGQLESRRAFGKRNYCDVGCVGEAKAKSSKDFREDARGRVEARKITDKAICEECGATEKLHVHHVDENPRNNASENRKVLCHGCHVRVHHEKPSPPCSICGVPSEARGLCEKHYSRWKRHGDPLGGKDIPKTGTYRKVGEDNPMIPCACGCGGMRLKYNDKGKPRNYIVGHGRKGRTGRRVEESA